MDVMKVIFCTEFEFKLIFIANNPNIFDRKIVILEM